MYLEKSNNNLNFLASHQKKLTTIELKNPKVFLKKSKKDIKLIPLKNLNSQQGLTKHIPPQSTEWVNSVYSYNTNYNKFLTIADKYMMKLIRSYVNFKFRKLKKGSKQKKALLLGLNLSKYRYKKHALLPSLKKRLSVNKIFVGKGNIKHTPNKALLTIFLFKNSDNFVWIKNFRKMVFFSLKRILLGIASDKFRKYKYFSRESSLKIAEKKYKYKYKKNQRKAYFAYLEKKLVFNYFLKNNLLSKEELATIYIKNSFFKFMKVIPHIKNKIKDDFTSFYQKKGSFEAIIQWKAKLHQKLLHKVNKEYRFFSLNELKFKNSFLENFRRIASKVYNKNVIFNFIKLRKFYLNSDIYSQIIALKLKRRELNISQVLGKSLDNIELPRLPSKRRAEILKDKLRINLLSNNNILDLFTIKSRIAKNLWFEEILFKYDRLVNPFSLFGRIMLSYRNMQNLGSVSHKAQKKLFNQLLKKFMSFVKFVKNGDLAGIRVEIKGRLTKRFKASRALSKLKFIGGLRNIDASFLGLSVYVPRNFGLANVENTVLSSKRRIGAFGVKGWVSSMDFRRYYSVPRGQRI